MTLQIFIAKRKKKRLAPGEASACLHPAPPSSQGLQPARQDFRLVLGVALGSGAGQLACRQEADGGLRLRVFPQLCTARLL